MSCAQTSDNGFRDRHPGYSQFKSPYGYDLRFMNSAETSMLNYEIEDWNTSGDSYVWVQVPVFTNNCYVWAYWGNPYSTEQRFYTTNGATWSQGYVGVWHLHEGASNSVANIYNGTISGSTNAAGLSAGSQGFGGDGDKVSIDSDAIPAGGAFSISCWVKPVEQDGTLFEAGNNSSIYFFSGFNTGNIRWAFESANDADVNAVYASTVSLDQWHAFHVEGRWNGSSHKLYIDSTEVADSTTATDGKPSNLAANMTWGANGPDYSNPYGHLDGLLDEIRISDTARSTNWIWAAWMNMASNSAFSSYESVSYVGPAQTFFIFR